MVSKKQYIKWEVTDAVVFIGTFMMVFWLAGLMGFIDGLASEVLLKNLVIGSIASIISTFVVVKLVKK